MGSELPAGLLREGLMLISLVGGPVFGVLLIVGLVVGVLQAATQINDPAVGFLPRLVATVGVIALFGGWMMERMAGFLTVAIERMASRGF